MPLYRYHIEGRAAKGQTWATEGTITAHSLGQFDHVVSDARAASFEQLTQGKAEYGSPGLGCHGPYTITRMTVELLEN